MSCCVIVSNDENFGLWRMADCILFAMMTNGCVVLKSKPLLSRKKVVKQSLRLAQHRESKTLDVSDVQLALSTSWNITGEWMGSFVVVVSTRLFEPSLSFSPSFIVHIYILTFSACATTTTIPVPGLERPQPPAHKPTKAQSRSTSTAGASNPSRPVQKRKSSTAAAGGAAKAAKTDSGGAGK